MNYSKEILNQLLTLTPRPVLWSWGASKFQSVKGNQLEGIGEDYLAGLIFYVRGMKHKGHVFITLAGNDTYTVSIGHLRRLKFNVKKQEKDVYFDELYQVIDELIERQEHYAF
jgi:hypothetical protein